jgi:hypothetical protein
MKLTKKDITERDHLVRELDDAGGALRAATEEFNRARSTAWGLVEAALSAFNAQVEELYVPVQAAVEKFDEALQAAADFAGAQADDAQAEIDDKSERWQEGEAGERARSFVGEWESARDGKLSDAVSDDRDFAAPGPVEVDEPEALTEFDPSEYVQTLEGAPTDSSEV